MLKIDIVDVVIIGVGLVGLIVVYLFGKVGYIVIVIEKDLIYVGGISCIVEYEGFWFDIGGYWFFLKLQLVVDFWNEILFDDFIECFWMSWIYYEGKFYSYLLCVFEVLGNFGFWCLVLCMLSYVKVKLRFNMKV